MAKVKHIALVKFNEGTPEEQVDRLFDELLDLSENVEGVEDFVWGPNSSPEALNQGYTHGFIMTFADSASRDTYLNHPDHEKFKNDFAPLLESVAVVDFEVT